MSPRLRGLLLTQTEAHKFLPCPRAEGLPHRECFGIVREDSVIHHPAVKGETVTGYRLAYSLSSLYFIFLWGEKIGEKISSVVIGIQPAVHLR